MSKQNTKLAAALDRISWDIPQVVLDSTHAEALSSYINALITERDALRKALVDYDDAACTKNQTMLIIIGLLSRVHSNHAETITAARAAVEQAIDAAGTTLNPDAAQQFVDAVTNPRPTDERTKAALARHTKRFGKQKTCGECRSFEFENNAICVCPPETPAPKCFQPRDGAEEAKP